MSKITYLWGAGASFGVREKAENNRIVKGVPVINEFSDALQNILTELKPSTNHNPFVDESHAAEVEALKYLYKKFTALYNICQEYPTVDTFARQLFVTKSKPYDYDIEDYDELKRILSVFLLLIQDVKTRDSRYDGFISSIIKDDGTFPPMTVLSWNYDAQFEMAYSGYSRSGRYVPSLWQELNVVNKTYLVSDPVKVPFSMVKLNGTAFFKIKGDSFVYQSRKALPRLYDNYFGGNSEDKYTIAYKLLTDKQYEHTLSYVWEQLNKKEIVDFVKARVQDTEELIVIGYSFPYVNRDIDEVVLTSMPSLRKIVIQDPNAPEIKERIQDMLRTNASLIEIKVTTNTSQFYLPNSF